jgi:hypothetical protein
MNLERPFGVVTPTLDGAVLQALLTVEHLESGAEIHRRCGTGSAHGVRKVLSRLVDQGIVFESDYGNAKYYRLERRHISYAAVVAMANVQTLLVERTREQLSPVRGLLHASFIALEPLTVLLVAQDDAVRSGGVWTFWMEELEKALTIWTGSRPELRQHTAAEFAAMTLPDDALVVTAQSDAPRQLPR